MAPDALDGAGVGGVGGLRLHVGPIAITAAVSFNSVEQSRFPPVGLSLRWWPGVLDPQWLEPLQFSLELATVSAIAATLMGLPLAFALARHRFPGRDALAMLALSPLMLPALVTGIGLLQLLELAGLGDLLGLPALVVGHVVICLPFVVRTITISLGGVPMRVEDAARSLGATNRVVLFEVTFPLIKSGLFSGATFAFIQSFTDYSMSLFLTSPADRPITIAILNYIEYGFTPTLAAVAVVTLLIPLVLVLIVQRYFRVADFIQGSRPMAEPAVALSDLHKSFGLLGAVNGIDLNVTPGELLTLLGPSGCGKTTTLNLIAGFLRPDRGTIHMAGQPVDALPPFRRDIGLVFQDYALFPHMTVAGNVAFGLRMRKVAKPEIARRVENALAWCTWMVLANAGPRLSGGQRQRVALARALVIRPTVLLLDEPLSNLDLKLREEMRLEIMSLQRRLGITTILVTHDQGEALAVSDRFAVMYRGALEQVGRPDEIYERPRTRFVAEFIGTTNFIPGEAQESAAAGATLRVATPYGAIACRAPAGVPAGCGVLVAVRPERLRLAGGVVADGDLLIPGKAESLVYLGNKVELYVRSTAGQLHVLEMANDGRLQQPRPGMR